MYDQHTGQPINQTAIYHVRCWFYVSSADMATAGVTEARAYSRYQYQNGAQILMDHANQTALDLTGTPAPFDVVIPPTYGLKRNSTAAAYW